MNVAWRKHVLEASLILLESLWLYAAISFITITSEGRLNSLSWPAVLAVIAAGFFSARLLEHLNFSLGKLRLIGVAVAVFCIYVVLLARFGGIFFFGSAPVVVKVAEGIALAECVIFWWRGLRLGQETTTFDTVLFSFGIGTAVLTAVTVFDALLAAHLGISRLVLPFFSFGLLGLALAHLARMDEAGSLPLSRYWMGVLGGTVGGLVLLGLLLGLVPTEEIERLFAPVLAVLGWAAYGIAYVVLLPVGYLVQIIIVILQRILRFGAFRQQAQEQPSLMEEMQDKLSGEPLIPPQVFEAAKWIVLVILAGLVILWLARAFSLRHRLRGEEADAFRESLWAEGTLRRDLDGLLQGMLGRWRRQPRGAAFWVGASGNLATVYNIYVSLLELAASLGKGRQAWQTPHEFEGELAGLFPEGEVGRITAAFERGRYGSHEPTDAEVASLREDLDRVKGNITK